ncbi:hypothetical protein KC318_g5960, partial [Hortaea werneckii]
IALEERDGELAETNDELAEKSDALAATYQQLQEMTDKCESLKQQLRKRPATPMSSNCSRAKPHSPLATTFNMPDDDVDYEQGNEQDVQDEQPDDQYEQQPGDQLSGPASSDSSSTSKSREDETPIVERDLEHLGVGLKIVAYNSESRLVYQRCPECLLKGIILRQLAEFRAAYGDGYVGHFSERHRSRDHVEGECTTRWEVQSSGCFHGHPSIVLNHRTLFVILETYFGTLNALNGHFFRELALSNDQKSYSSVAVENNEDKMFSSRLLVYSLLHQMTHAF